MAKSRTPAVEGWFTLDEQGLHAHLPLSKQGMARFAEGFLESIVDDALDARIEKESDEFEATTEAWIENLAGIAESFSYRDEVFSVSTGAANVSIDTCKACEITQLRPLDAIGKARA